MSIRPLIRFTIIIGLVVLGREVIVRACGGTPRPNCGRSIFLAKFVPATVVYPGPATPIVVPVGLVPFVTWNTMAPCAQPVSATLALTLTCAPPGGAPATLCGPTTTDDRYQVLGGSRGEVNTAARRGSPLGPPVVEPPNLSHPHRKVQGDGVLRRGVCRRFIDPPIIAAR